MGEVVVEFVAGEGADVMSDDEALAQGFVDCHGEPAAQFGQPDEQQAQAPVGVHVEVGEQPEVFEDVVSEVVCLVDDEHGELLGFGDQAGDLVADGAIGVGSRAFGGQAEFPGDGHVHVEHAAGGERDVVDAMQSRVQSGGDVPADGGLAGADLAGQQADAAQFDEVLQARLGLAVGAGLEQLVGLEVVLEGQVGEGEVALVHQSLSLSLRIAMGDGGGSGAGLSVSIREAERARRTAVLA